MNVPLLDLQAQYAPLRDEILAADHARLRQPALHHGAGDRRRSSASCAALLGVEHAIAVSSGTDALLLALMALGIKAGDEVVTPTYSFFATAGAIVARRRDAGARRHRSRRRSTSIRRRRAAAITPRTKAIMPVHLFGLSADMDPILDAADARRRPGHRGRGAGDRRRPTRRVRSAAIGAFGCFSFFPSKNLGAFGDAGLLTTNDAGWRDARGCCARTGWSRSTTTIVVGAQLPDGRAAGGGAAREGAASGGAGPRRGARTPRATARCSATAGLDRRRRRCRSSRRIAAHLQPVRHPDAPIATGSSATSTHAGIGNEIYYPVPFHLQPCFADLGYRPGDFPHAERAAPESLAIPIYGELTARAAGDGRVARSREFVARSRGRAIESRDRSLTRPAATGASRASPTQISHRARPRHPRRLLLAIARRRWPCTSPGSPSRSSRSPTPSCG